jgi:hypothetical protein
MAWFAAHSRQETRARQSQQRPLVASWQAENRAPQWAQTDAAAAQLARRCRANLRHGARRCILAATPSRAPHSPFISAVPVHTQVHVVELGHSPLFPGQLMSVTINNEQLIKELSDTKRQGCAGWTGNQICVQAVAPRGPCTCTRSMQAYVGAFLRKATADHDVPARSSTAGM